MADFSHKHSHQPATEELSARETWNKLYAGKEQVWSGKPNATLVSLIEEHEPTTVLDLGCGEGGDVQWLAQQGWDATGIDISDIAIGRARKSAQRLGLEAEFVAADLSQWNTDKTFDLIISSFMQSHEGDLDRLGIFRQALELLNPGGELISISHAGLPSFVADDDPRKDYEHHLPNPFFEAQSLTEHDQRFTVLLAEKRSRNITSPAGEAGVIDDGIMRIKRFV